MVADKQKHNNDLTIQRQLHKRRIKKEVKNKIRKSMSFIFGTGVTDRNRSIPTQTIFLSNSTFLEIEKWVKYAESGQTNGKFGSILKSTYDNNENVFDAIHALTLAQIMPYKKMLQHLKLYDSLPIQDEYDFIDTVSEKYCTTHQNVVDRINHVKQIYEYRMHKKRLLEQMTQLK